VYSKTRAAEDAQRQHGLEVDDLSRKHRYQLQDALDEHRSEIDQLRRDARDNEDSLRKQSKDYLDEVVRDHQKELSALEKRLQRELEEERDRRIQEVQELTTQRDSQLKNVAQDIGKKEREAEVFRSEIEQKNAELDRQKRLNAAMEVQLAETKANVASLEAQNRSISAKVDFLESDNQQQSHAFADLHKRMQEAIDSAGVANAKLRAEETLIRKLRNQILELKGNIRVFCRVRPTLGAEDAPPAKIKFPDQGTDNKELAVVSEKENALGNITQSANTFSFDRVFGPDSGNCDVFEEISQLVQSALDGYNVCIFCYGQTGSGKTYTMSSPDGMIPRAVRQIYDIAKGLEEKGWVYTMQGSFVEVYNEVLNDLLGCAEDFDKPKKHEIRHDEKRKRTTVTDITTVELDSPDRVADVLKRADGNRSVASTKANMRSSRSHSVFMLTLVGKNEITGETSEGTLNLVDLAGSERLAHSQAEGQRLKETQSINKSLSSLGDVISALGKGGEGGHVPYRNSKVRFPSTKM
jgi:kinesin family member C1